MAGYTHVSSRAALRGPPRLASKLSRAIKASGAVKCLRLLPLPLLGRREGCWQSQREAKCDENEADRNDETPS